MDSIFGLATIFVLYLPQSISFIFNFNFCSNFCLIFFLTMYYFSCRHLSQKFRKPRLSSTKTFRILPQNSTLSCLYLLLWSRSISWTRSRTGLSGSIVHSVPDGFAINRWHRQQDKDSKERVLSRCCSTFANIILQITGSSRKTSARFSGYNQRPAWA